MPKRGTDHTWQLVKYNYDGVVGIFEISNDSVFSIEYQMKLK